MSLQTDRIFVRALRSNSEFLSQLPSGDVYSIAIREPDMDLDNTPLPYVIVTFDGLQNDTSTKDDSWEGDEDIVRIGIEIAAETRSQLAQLAETVRRTVVSFFDSIEETDEDYDLVPLNISLSAEAVQYDSLKPCFWQVLNYQCDTNI